MPVMDGFEASRQIRAYERENGLQNVHIIALTGAASAEAQDESKGSGINFHLIKPVGLAHLKMVLDDILIGQGSPDIGKEVEHGNEEKQSGALAESIDSGSGNQEGKSGDRTATTQAGHDNDAGTDSHNNDNQKDEPELPNRNDSTMV